MREKILFSCLMAILTTKEMLQRLPIAFAQVKADNSPWIWQIVYSLHWAKEITRKVCNNILSST